MAAGTLNFGVGDLILLFTSSIVLWVSAKIFGSSLGLFSAFVIRILASLASKFVVIFSPTLLSMILISILVDVVLISAFGKVGLIRAFLINIFPTLVFVGGIVLLIGAIGAAEAV